MLVVAPAVVVRARSLGACMSTPSSRNCSSMYGRSAPCVRSILEVAVPGPLLMVYVLI